MAFDYSRLKGKIVEKYGTQANFAKALGVTEPVLSLKMNNKTKFNSDDIIKMANLLEISPNEIGVYFFTKIV